MTGVVNLTVFLTSANILGPIAGMGFLVVEEPADAELLGGGPVPTSPVSGAGGLVPEDPVEPVAVLGVARWIWNKKKVQVDTIRTRN